MPYPFDDGAEPLDMSGLGPPTPQPTQGGALPPDQRKQWLRLAMILPLALKAGPGAIEGFLGGLNKGDQQTQATQRQAALDQQRQQQIAEQEQYRRQVFEQTQTNQQDTRRQALLKDFATQLSTAQGDADVRALLELYGPQAKAIGLRPAALESYAMQTQSSDKLRARKITETWAKLPTESKTEAMKNGWTLNVGDEQVPFEQWSAVVGGLVDPKTGRPPVSTPKVDVPNTPEEQFYQRFATENGAASFAALPTAKQQRARKLWMQADDRLPAGTGGTANPRTDTRIDRIVNSFNSHPIVKEYNEVQSQHGILQQIVGGQWSGPGDMAAVFAFMKALDPNSVVRETEYANAAASGNIFMGWAARFNGAVSPNGGFLSDRVRQDFLRTINSRLSVKTKQYDNLRRQLVERVDRIKAGAPETGDEAIVDYSTGGDAPLSGQGVTTLPDGTKIRRVR